MIEFLSQSDMTYTKYGVSGQCLFRKVGWWVKDLLDIINGSELHSFNFVSIFLEKLTFSQLYDFIKSDKQFVYDKNIFYTSCLCDNCKNIVLLGLKVWTIINESQLQLVFPKHRMILLKNTAVHLMTKIVCTECSFGKLYQLPDSNPDSESDFDSNSDSDTSCLVSF